MRLIDARQGGCRNTNARYGLTCLNQSRTSSNRWGWTNARRHRHQAHGHDGHGPGLVRPRAKPGEVHPVSVSWRHRSVIKDLFS